MAEKEQKNLMKEKRKNGKINEVKVKVKNNP